MSSYKTLIVWQKAFALAKATYQLTEQFPKSEIYGLTSQLRRASVSVVSNLAEGFSRKSPREHHQFVSIAFGSTSEIETQLLLAKDLEFGRLEEFEKTELLLEEVRKILNVMLQRLKLKS
ncbi:MAG: four helix bundle protein [Patescibacteria group bacterium]